jgi:putative transposase
VTLLAYQFALEPTPTQERALRSHAGAARVAFNWGLAQVKSVMDQRAAEVTYGITGDDMTPSLSWSLYSLRKDWNQAKDKVAPWWQGCSKEAFNTGLDQLARALKNWGDSWKGKRKGTPVGFPRFKSKRKARPSIRWTTGAFRCEAGHAVLPRVGRVKLHEDGRRLSDLVAASAARVVSVSVRFERGRWFASFTVEQDVSRPAPIRPDVAVGVDLGIKTLAVVATSTGETFEVPNPRHMSKALRKVRRLSRAASRRRGPDRRTGRRSSNRWRRADAARNNVLGRVADHRKDAIHKLTTSLASTYGTVVVEDLHVRGMLANHRLARHVADASFAEIRHQLTYKTAWRGGTLIVADRWFASSKTCSQCGAVKAKLALSERQWTCTACGTVLDRDVNAAVNLARLAASGADSNGRGADRKTGLVPQVAVKRQPGRTAPAVCETGTVPTQDGTAA